MNNEAYISLQARRLLDDKQHLSSLISRINQQRGSFRTVIESSLDDEIRAVDRGQAQDLDSIGAMNYESNQDTKSQQGELSTSREKILRQVGQAYMESAHALDFISLLESRYAPRQAEITLSSFLKQNLPLGSLGTESMQAPHKSDAEKQNEQMVSLGWRMQSLNSTADSLLRSAERLKAEVEKEARYWGHLLIIKEEGWPLCRLPREKHTLGVRYGFAQAISDLHDRGIAALRRNEDGSINLDRSSKSMEDKSLQVQILEKGSPVVRQTTMAEPVAEEMSICHQLLKARDSVFDEELHHELHREARSLINQGIRCIDDRILVQYEDDKEIEINLVPDGDNLTLSSGLVANSIAVSLRLLLVHAHRQIAHRRSQYPPPIKENRTPRALFAILRPILAHLQHRHYVQSCKLFLDGLTRSLSLAAVKFDPEHLSSSRNLLEIGESPSSGSKMIEDIIDAIQRPLHSTFRLHLPSTFTTATIEIQTSLQSPSSGTSYICKVSTLDKTSSSAQHYSLAAMEAHICHLVELDLTAHFASGTQIGSGWQIISTHEGRLSRTNREAKRRETIKIIVQRNCVGLQWQYRGTALAQDGFEKWASTGANHPKAKGMAETIVGILGDQS